MIQLGKPALVLAPMEGVTDFPMRRLMTELGGFTHCVTEFLRVSQEVPPPRSLRDIMPELNSQARTSSGIPVQLQLLGGDPERLAQTAVRACELGSPGIDLNFGCPAPTVNRHDGGATLLKFPDRIRSIVESVRAAVPAHLPVSAKMRLGWDTIDSIFQNAAMAAEGGASWITIHARTRMAAYQPPVFWEQIKKVRAQLPGRAIVANGDIWSFEDFLRCRDITGCEHFMLGRGALADPGLAQQVAQELGIFSPEVLPRPQSTPLSPEAWGPLLARFIQISWEYFPSQSAILSRCKQWIRMAHRHRGLDWFDAIKRFETLAELEHYLGISTPSSSMRPPLH